MHVATTPISREGEQWWLDRHKRAVEAASKSNIELMFIGDSITQGWEGEGAAVWEKYYGNRKAANFGFSGDRTEHVLWRLDNGEMPALSPKVVVIMIGTNNVGHGSSTPEQTADGVRAIVSRLVLAMPSSKILLLGIFPRGEAPDDSGRRQARQATLQFAGLADRKRVFFLDVGEAFVHTDGRLRTSLMPDRLHLNSSGYELWARAMEPMLAKLLR